MNIKSHGRGCRSSIDIKTILIALFMSCVIAYTKCGMRREAIFVLVGNFIYTLAKGHLVF